MTGSRRIRALGLARLVWAGLLLAYPARVIRALGGRADGRSVDVIRILGARHAGQGLIEAGVGSDLAGLGPVVDGLHAASAVVFGAWDRARRRPAFTDAAVAGAWGVLGWFAGRRR